jgi:hypothetical protein
MIDINSLLKSLIMAAYQDGIDAAKDSITNDIQYDTPEEYWEKTYGKSEDIS